MYFGIEYPEQLSHKYNQMFSEKLLNAISKECGGIL